MTRPGWTRGVGFRIAAAAFAASALGVGIVALGILIVAYVHKYRSSVNSEGAPVTVLIAKQAIPKGTSGTVIATTPE